MPSIRYINQSAPFWDFVASLEEQGSNHPFFNARDNRDNSGEQQFPWGFSHPWASWGHPPHRDGHRGPHRGPHHGPEDHSAPPPPPPGHEGPPGSPPQHDGPPPPPGPHSPPSPGPGGPHREHSPHGHRGCHGRRGGRHGFGRGRWHGPGDRSLGAGFNLGALGEFLQSQIFGETQEARTEGTETREAASGDHKPDVDVFDTESAYVVHVSLPGAKKEDVGVNWDAEKSELSIAGVIYRPGDEDFLKTLAMDERKVGPFERKIRLGSRANPAVVDADGITAKLEDGVLRVEVPKEDKDYVEIKKVDVE